MSISVDLRDLTLDRERTELPMSGTRRHLLTRYVLPMLLGAGFLSLVIWAAWDRLFPPHPVTVVPVVSSTSTVQQAGTPLFKAAGWIEPRPTPVRVAGLAPGVVEELLVVEDQPVKAGETIAELVREDAQLAFDRARADLHLREAELAEAEATLAAAVTRLKNPVHLEASLGEAEAILAKIETELKNLPFVTRRAASDLKTAEKNYAGKLAARDAVAGIQIEIAKGKMDSAKAFVEELQTRVASLKNEQLALTRRRDALRTQLELLVDEVKARDEAAAQLKAAQARVEQVTVAVAEAKLQLDRMTIIAPIDGRVFRLIAHPGTRIGNSSSQTTGHDSSTVVTMYDPQMLQVRVDVRFEDLPKIRLHQLVEIDNPALKTPITGKVLFISSEADIQKNTLQVKVEIPAPPAVFKPEMLVDVTFLAAPEPERSSEPQHGVKLFVPRQLIQQGEGGSFVWVADQSQGTARRDSVETGQEGRNGLVEIRRGLTITSKLIASGIEGLGDGDRIRITGENRSLGLEGSVQIGERKESPNRLPSREEDHDSH